MLPVELLEHILLDAVKTKQGVVNTSTVHRLAQVSKTWHSIILRHPGFWTSINVSMRYSYQAHKQLKYLENSLKRSGSLLLDVEWVLGIDCEHFMPDIVSCFASYGGFARWRTLVTQDWLSVTLDDMAEMGPLLNLTELTLKAELSTIIFEHILLTATQLQTLTVDGSISARTNLQYSKLFPRITRFTGPIQSSTRSVQKFRALHHLELDQTTGGLTSDLLRGLHSLTLRGSCAIANAGRYAPNLRSLTLEGYARRDIQLIRAPNLESLTLRNVYELYHLMGGLKNVMKDSPCLRRLCLYTPVELGDLRALRGQIGKSIEEFSICMDLRSSSTHGDIASALVERFPWSRDPMKDGHGEVLFPQLKSLEIVAAYSGVKPDVYCRLARRLMTGRRGTKLEFVSCRIDGERVFIVSVDGV